jgi:transcriptional regulator of NAD metabolism
MLKIVFTKPSPVSNQEIAFFMASSLKNFQRELQNDPEMLEYYQENEHLIKEEVEHRVYDMIEMKMDADELRGNWRTRLLYRLSPR